MSPFGSAEPLTQEPAPSISIVDAVWLGLVEGLTEFLPVSSTGHLIVANRVLGVGESPLTVGIQLGAISAILVLYWRPLVDALRNASSARSGGKPNLLAQIVVAALPAAVLGLLLDDWIEARLFSAEIVASTMVVGGVLLLWVEKIVRGRAPRAEHLSQMGYATALAIGCFQCLSLVPGTSRSGATIAGALLLGLSRTAAAEFSFLVGLPILYGAGLVKLVSERESVSGALLAPMVVGTLVSFLSAIVVVRPFVDYLRAHTFAPFAWYRILGGALLAVACASSWI